MSNAIKQRIKSFRQWDYADSKFQEIIPFGTDGDLVDVYSDLDLEEQLLIGGFKTIKIEETNEATTIIEKFYNMTSTIVDNVKTHSKDSCIYSKVTEIISESVYGAIEANQDDEVLGEDNYIIGQLLSIKDLEIKISLYLGDYQLDNQGNINQEECQLLYQKIVKTNADNQIEEILL